LAASTHVGSVWFSFQSFDCRLSFSVDSHAARSERPIQSSDRWPRVAICHAHVDPLYAFQAIAALRRTTILAHSPLPQRSISLQAIRRYNCREICNCWISRIPTITSSISMRSCRRTRSTDCASVPLSISRWFVADCRPHSPKSICACGGSSNSRSISSIGPLVCVRCNCRTAGIRRLSICICPIPSLG
jgi:hypothetical protein